MCRRVDGMEMDGDGWCGWWGGWWTPFETLSDKYMYTPLMGRTRFNDNDNKDANSCIFHDRARPGIELAIQRGVLVI